MNVPFFDLKKQHDHLRPTLEAAIESVFETGIFVGGPVVASFEQKLAAYYHMEHAIGVANGTDALHVALHALGVGPGDEVITTAYSYVATANVIKNMGATPVFVDIDPVYYTLDVDQIPEKITPRTRAILPVHLFGQMAPMSGIRDLAAEHHLAIIEDAAQAHGARQANQLPGTYGDMICLSFYPTKQQGALGDAGALLVRSTTQAQACRLYTNHGGTDPDHIGINSRLDPIQAAMLEAKQKYLEDWIEARRKVVATYCGELASIDALVLPKEAPDNYHSYYNMVVQVPDVSDFESYLYDRDIGTKRNYPYVLPYLSHLKDGRTYPNADHLAEHAISLPLFPELTEVQVTYVIDAVKTYFA